MSNGNQFRQSMLKHTAQHQHRADAFSRHARERARAADQGFQARSRARAEQTAQMGQQRQFQADRARQLGQQQAAWRVDNHELAGSRGAAGGVLGFAIKLLLKVLLIVGWLAWMGWVLFGG